MNRIDDGGPAFPRAGCTWTEDYGDGAFPEDGMSLRDWFAGQAMVGLCSTMSGIDLQLASIDQLAAGNALVAYRFADAMLAERLQKKQANEGKGGAA